MPEILDIDGEEILATSEQRRRERELAEVQREREPVLDQEEQTESFSLIDYAKDFGLAPLRGVEGFIQGIYGLGDMLAGDALPDYDERLLDRSETFFGGLAEGMTQFALGFWVPAGWIGRGAHIGRSLRAASGARLAVPGISKLSKAGQAALKAQGKTKAAIGLELGRASAAGAITDFAVFDGQEARLSNLIQSYPELANPVTEFLASDMSASELTNRAKAALEGIPIGLVFDGFVASLQALRRARQLRQEGKSPQEVADAVREETDSELLRQSAVEQHASDFERVKAETPPEQRPPEEMFEQEIRSEQAGEVIPRDVGPAGPLEGVFVEPPSGDVYSGTLPNGEVVRIRREIPESGGTKKVWVDAETGEVFGNTKSTKADVARLLHRRAESQSEAKKLFDARDRLDPEGAAREIPEHVPLFDGQKLKSSLTAIADRLNVGGQDVNPRGVPREELMDLGLAENDVNLALIDAEPAAVVRALADVYHEQAWSDAAGHVGDAELRVRAQNALADISGDARPLAIIADEHIKSADQTVAHMLAWRTYLDHQAREVLSLGAKAADATVDDAPVAYAKLMAAHERAVIGHRALKSIEAVSGRLLRANQVPFVGYQRLADQLQLTGGLDEVKEYAKRLKEVGDDPLAAFDLIREARRSTLMEVTMEWFMNSILSGGRTHAINAMSGAAMVVWRPLERMLGSAMTLDGPGVKDALSEFSWIYEAARNAFKVGWQAARQNEGILKGGAGSKATEFLPRTRGGRHRKAITGEGILGPDAAQKNPGWSAMIDHMGGFFRIPSAVLTGVDEVVRQVTFHIEAKQMLMRHNLDKGMHPEAAVEDASRRVADLTYRHQVISEEALYRKHLEDVRARQADEFPDVLSQQREAARRAKREWDSSEGSLERLIAEEAVRGGDENTFQRQLNFDGPADEAVTAKFAGIVQQHPVLRLFATFIKTPYNILRWNKERTLDPALAATRYLMSPMSSDGGLAAAVQRGEGMQFVQVNKIKNSLVRDLNGDIDLRGLDPNSPQGQQILQRRKQEAWGRVATGIGVGSLFLTAAANGQITGRGPTDPEQRKLLEDAGWLPYSIKIGDSYIEYRRLDPFATMLGTIADIYTAGRYAPAEDQSLLEEGAQALFISLANNATNKTYMTGVKHLVNLLTEPGQAGGRIMRNYAGALVPTGWSEMSKFLAGDDPVMREVRSWTDAVLNKLPYYGDELDPVRNFMGEPVRKIESFGEDTIGQVANLFVPIAYREVSDHLIAKEVAVLDHAFSPPRRRLGGVDLGATRNARGQSAYDRMLQLRKEVKIDGKTLKIRLRELLRSREYQAMDPSSTLEARSPRVDEVNRIVQRYHRKAVQQMEREFPEVHREKIRVRREMTQRRRGVFDFDQLQRR